MNNIKLRNNYISDIKKVLLISIFFLILIIKLPLADDAKKQLKEIEKKLEQNQKQQNKLKIKQKKINKNIKNIESILKKNERKINNYFSEKKLVVLEIDNSKKNKEEIQKDLNLLKENKRKIIYSLISDDSENKKNNQVLNTNVLLTNIYKNITNKIDLNNKKLKETNKIIKDQEKNLANLKNQLANINNKVLENSDLETTLQGESLITLIQRKEKELENFKISKKAKELRALIETLKTRRNLSRNRITQEYNFQKIENILPINLKNIEKIRTDTSKKGILLTLKKKSFLTTPRDGLVVYADSFKGYGNMVILDLGNNYHIIYSGLTNIMCSEGDWLNTGNILGEIKMKYKVNEVYLEVRFKGKTLDPSNWLKS